MEQNGAITECNEFPPFSLSPVKGKNYRFFFNNFYQQADHLMTQVYSMKYWAIIDSKDIEICGKPVYLQTTH